MSPCPKLEYCNKEKTFDFFRLTCADDYEVCPMFDGCIDLGRHRKHPKEWMFEHQFGCERCERDVLAGLNYSPNEDKELYLCDRCAYREFREAVTIRTSTPLQTSEKTEATQ